MLFFFFAVTQIPGGFSKALPKKKKGKIHTQKKVSFVRQVSCIFHNVNMQPTPAVAITFQVSTGTQGSPKTTDVLQTGGRPRTA